MLPTEILEEEHAVILKLLEVIRSISKKIDKVESDTLQKIIDFIRTFADHCHHAKEEKVLFVEAEKQGVPREGGPIGMMLIEHDEGRSYVKGMDEALKKNDLGSYKENALRFAELLEQHIGKENQILYPMINMHLSEDLQKQILKKFDKVEQDDVGAGIHHKYQTLVEELERRWLKC